MIARCLALLLAASTVAAAGAGAQQAADVAPALAPAVAAYRNGDLATAEAGFRALASSNPDAEAWLGAVLLDRGADREALRLIQHAAAAGSAEGNHRLGLAYAQGRAGLPPKEAKAAELFEKAAASGHTRAQINLGILYLRGKGVAPDMVQARAWLEKAAASDDPQALYALGRALSDSSGQAMADPV